jgi:hypothetical protein
MRPTLSHRTRKGWGTPGVDRISEINTKPEMSREEVRGAGRMRRSFVGRPSRCEGLRFLRITKFFVGRTAEAAVATWVDSLIDIYSRKTDARGRDPSICPRCASATWPALRMTAGAECSARELPLRDYSFALYGHSRVPPFRKERG